MFNIITFLKKITWVFFVLFFTIALIYGKDKEKKKEKTPSLPIILEEIVVTGKVPAQQPLSTVSLLEEQKLQRISPKNLGDIMNYISGTYVTKGQKNEYRLQIRGMLSNRLTLLYDGVPVYEPYFNSFDLGSFVCSGIKNIKVIKGASSVLYGANTLGGIVNIVSKHYTEPFLSLRAELSDGSAYLLSGSAGYNWEKFDVSTNFTFDHSNGFKWNNDGNLVERKASDYKRKVFKLKSYYYPSKNSEIIAQVLYHIADYGVPAPTEYMRPRYWRFKDWQRLQFILGSLSPIFKDGILKTRLYYTKHYNILDAYESPEYKKLQWESTYNNYSFGSFVFGEFPIDLSHNIKVSVNARLDHVKQQDDAGDNWDTYQHATYSIGIEDHFDLSNTLKLIGGVSLDYLNKQDGDSNLRLNPIIGINFHPKEWLGFHISYMQKSRFPSMKSLYSTSSGNPELIDETGRNIEFGVNYDLFLHLKAAVFQNNIYNMIQSYRRFDGYKSYLNIGKAKISGIEIELGKKFGKFNFNINYTLLDAIDMDSDDPLDYVPSSQLNLFMQVGEFKGFLMNLWGILVSKSQAKIGKKEPLEVINIPKYTLLNCSIEKIIGQFNVFIKIENILNKYYFTEPGYPMKARSISFGFSSWLGGER